MHCDWHELYAKAHICQLCGLCTTRTNVVIGDGNPRARIMLVGEGPGRDEDAQGIPFVGTAGKLLNKMLAAINLTRDDVYIANIVKCRPPNNRTPTDEEAIACLPYLREQFVLVRPQIIVCLGATAARYICGPQTRITRDRGKWICKSGVHIIATYHPAALLRDESKKYDAWTDMKSIRAKYNEIYSKSDTQALMADDKT